MIHLCYPAFNIIEKIICSGAFGAESGLGTFRIQEGLWDKYKIEEVATPQAFDKNPGLVLDFYNIEENSY